jgi:hypothetical protein
MSVHFKVFLALSRQLENHKKAVESLTSVLQTAPINKIIYPTFNYKELKDIIEHPGTVPSWRVIVHPVLPTEATLLARKIRQDYVNLAHPWIIDTDVLDKQDYKSNHESANMNIGQLNEQTMKDLIGCSYNNLYCTTKCRFFSAT